MNKLASEPTTKVNQVEKDYWNDYYAKLDHNKTLIPSQFAAFISAECSDANTIIDIACGNGRDSAFFSNHFEKVFGVDASKEAIEGCTEYAKKRLIDNASFLQASVTSPEFIQTLSKLRGELVEKKTIVYARFFLHAITQSEEKVFFDSLKASLRTGDILALEFRTTRDASGQKATPEHYRRFVSPPTVYSELESRKFSLRYCTEGFGMAKYKNDDAYIARSIHEVL